MDGENFIGGITVVGTLLLSRGLSRVTIYNTGDTLCDKRNVPMEGGTLNG